MESRFFSSSFRVKHVQHVLVSAFSKSNFETANLLNRSKAGPFHVSFPYGRRQLNISRRAVQFVSRGPVF